MDNIIEKIKQADLRGRGGAGFPAWQKWQMVKDGAGDKKFVVCNVSEGEPAVFKDGYILEKWPEVVIDGIVLAMEAVGASKGYLYLRKDYFDQFKDKLTKIIGDKKIEIIREPGGYLGGEETALLDSIEGKRCEPRIKPPFPPQMGLWRCPTLINNLETLFFAAKIAKGEYKNTRFYSVSGTLANPGVFERGENLTVKEVLEKTGNWPDFEFFVQVGGGASGTILLQNELEASVSGAGSIVVYDLQKTDPRQLALLWLNFFIAENCGKCVPCREGVYRLREIFSQETFEPLDNARARDIVKLLATASFCPFGKGVANSLGSLMEKFDL